MLAVQVEPLCCSVSVMGWLLTFAVTPETGNKKPVFFPGSDPFCKECLWVYSGSHELKCPLTGLSASVIVCLGACWYSFRLLLTQAVKEPKLINKLAFCSSA